MCSFGLLVTVLNLHKMKKRRQITEQKYVKKRMYEKEKKYVLTKKKLRFDIVFAELCSWHKKLMSFVLKIKLK